MIRQRIALAAIGIGAIAMIGCATGPGTRADAEQSAAEPPDQTLGSAPASGSPSASPLPANVERLFSRMDAVGPKSQEAYEKELSAFQSSAAPIATLRAVYAQLPETSLATRWKTVHAAGKIHTPESVAFLEHVALTPGKIDPAVPGAEAGDQGFRMRYTASVGVVHHYMNGVAGAEAATERLLKESDSQIAQMVGVELFSAGKLTDAWRAILSTRGISTKFRRLSDAEFGALRNVDPARDAHHGIDTRRRPRSVSVPSLPNGE